MSVDLENEKDIPRLANLPINTIKANPRNPRLVFPAEELDKLSVSIAKEGILVPLVVFADDEGSFTLIDGERRYRCARDLGFREVPALVSEQKGDIEHLISMFNIHQMREQWQDMPTANALETLVSELVNQHGKEPSNSELSEITGLSQERIKRLRYATTLPSEYQGYIKEGTIPLNWFWELHRHVIQPLAQQRQAIVQEFGKEEIRQAFVDKRLSGIITDSVSLRRVRPIINLAARDAEESGSESSILDETLRNLIRDSELTIATAYEDSVQIMVETDKLDHNTKNMIKGFRRLLTKARNAEERAAIMAIAGSLYEELGQILSEA